MAENTTLFFSYARSDSIFALRLAKDLRAIGLDVWIDQLNIPVGSQWDSSIEFALKRSRSIVLIISQASAASANVQDEVSYAMEKDKRVIPILLENCELPFRWQRLQYIDFTENYNTALQELRAGLNVNQPGGLGSNRKREKTGRPKWYLGGGISGAKLGGIIVGIIAIIAAVIGTHVYLDEPNLPEKLVCLQPSENICRQHSAICEVSIAVDGKESDLCRWESVTRSSTCKRFGGIWTTVDSKFASQHPGAVKPWTNGACITQANNLKN